MGQYGAPSEVVGCSVTLALKGLRLGFWGVGFRRFRAEPLPSKDAYFKAFGLKDTYNRRLLGYFNAKGKRYCEKEA